MIEYMDSGETQLAEDSNCTGRILLVACGCLSFSFGPPTCKPFVHFFSGRVQTCFLIFLPRLNSILSESFALFLALNVLGNSFLHQKLPHHFVKKRNGHKGSERRSDIGEHHHQKNPGDFVSPESFDGKDVLGKFFQISDFGFSHVGFSET